MATDVVSFIFCLMTLPSLLQRCFCQSWVPVLIIYKVLLRCIAPALMDPSNEIFSLGTWRGMRVLSYTFGALSGKHWREVAYIWGVARLWDWSSSTIKSSSEHIHVWSMGCQPSASSAKSLVYPTAVPGLARLQWWMKPWVVWVWNVFVCALQRWKHWFGFKVNRASCKNALQWLPVAK